MGRRAITERVPCAETGCPEVSWREHETQRERAADWKRRQEHPWRCSRHSRPDEVLSETNAVREQVLVASKVPSRFGGFLDGLFWIPEGDENGGSRSCHGQGFRAFTEDFPEGTRLVVTARVELPSVSSGEQP